MSESCRVVVLAVDGSEYSEKAFECKYANSWFRNFDLVFLVWVIDSALDGLQSLNELQMAYPGL